MKIVVYHSSYGCDTGCCGHVVELRDDNDEAEDWGFRFEHPYGDDDKEFAERLLVEKYGEEHLKDLDWENCEIYDC